MNINNEGYKVSLEFNFKPKISTERIKEIFGNNIAEPGYLKPQGYWRGLYFKIYGGTLWTTMAVDGPSWVKFYHVTYYSMSNLIKKIVELPTENFVLTVNDAKTTITDLVLSRYDSYWVISNGYRSAKFERGFTGLQKSEIAEILKDYIGEAQDTWRR